MLLKAKAYPPPPLVRTKTEFRRCCGTPTRCAECQFPENREINRQFSKLPTISVRSVRFPVDLRCNPSALRMIPCSSLEQGIRVIEQGIHLSKTRDSPIPLGAFGNKIPLALFSPRRGDRCRSV